MFVDLEDSLLKAVGKFCTSKVGTNCVVGIQELLTGLKVSHRGANRSESSIPKSLHAVQLSPT